MTLTLQSRPLGDAGPTVADLVACAGNVGLKAAYDHGRLILDGAATTPAALSDAIAARAAQPPEVGECDHKGKMALAPSGRPTCTACGFEEGLN